MNMHPRTNTTVSSSAAIVRLTVPLLTVATIAFTGSAPSAQQAPPPQQQQQRETTDPQQPASVRGQDHGNSQTPSSAGAVSPGGPNSTAAENSGTGVNLVTITGCVQKARTTTRGERTPSGYILMNTSMGTYASTLGSVGSTTAGTSGGVDAPTPPGTPGVSGGIGNSGKSGSLLDSPRGSTLGSGLNFSLSGQGLDEHAGQYVEVIGHLASLETHEPGAKAARRSDVPQLVIVRSMRTLSNTCPQQ
jgi:hypothetical protein